MLLGAVLPLLGEAAVAAGAPGLATRAAVGVGTAAAFNKMSKPAAMVAREGSYQLRSAAAQNEPAPVETPVPNPALDQLLQNNDLTPFPNINRVLQDPNGRGLIDQAFHNITPIQSTAPAVDPKSLLTPDTLASGLIDPGAPEPE